MCKDIIRLRVVFSKRGGLIYSSHLDLMRAWERALRRAGVPLAYSGGFNPRPKLQLANALPLGHSGEAELLDIWLERPMPADKQHPVEELTKALARVLPDGLQIRQVQQVDPREPAMQTRVVATEYRVTVEGWDKPAGEVEARIEQVLAVEELSYERRGKRYNLRPLIEGLWLEKIVEREAVLGMRLSARPGATGRPEAVLDVLGVGEAFVRYQRQRLIWTSADG